MTGDRLVRAGAAAAAALLVACVAALTDVGQRADLTMFRAATDLAELPAWVVLRQSTWAFCGLAVAISCTAAMRGNRRALGGVAGLGIAVVTSLLVRSVLPAGIGTGSSAPGVSTAPSTHAVALFVALVVIGQHLPTGVAVRFGELAAGASLLTAIGFANVATFAHLPSDVIVGYLWAAAWMALFLPAASRRRGLILMFPLVVGGIISAGVALSLAGLWMSATGSPVSWRPLVAAVVLLWMTSLLAISVASNAMVGLGGVGRGGSVRASSRRKGDRIDVDKG